MIDILPKDFFVRPPTMDDLLVVHKLIEECDIAEYGEPEITLDDLRILWQSPTFNMASDAWMVIAPGDKVDSQNLTGATRLYERAGMHVARIHITYEKELRAGIELSTQAAPV
jgi:hypothetical protein